MTTEPTTVSDDFNALGIQFRGFSVYPDVYLMTRTAHERLTKQVPSSDEYLLHVSRMYGIPFEVFDDPKKMLERANKLTADGKRIVVLDHESDLQLTCKADQDEHK